MNLKLVPDLIPRTSFFKNLRAIVKPGEWDSIRRAVYAKSLHTCEACGCKDVELHCHEVWSYDEQTGIQKLTGFQALCQDCHEVKHIGFAQVKGRLNQALAHMSKVNGIELKQAKQIVEGAFLQWSQRSQRQWTLDITALETLTR